MSTLKTPQLLQLLDENRDELLCVTVRAEFSDGPAELILGLVEEDSDLNPLDDTHVEVFNVNDSKAVYYPQDLWTQVHSDIEWNILDIQVEEPENFSDALEQEMWQKIENL